MLKIRRINLFAGPGCGKTTSSWELASMLKNHFIHNKIDTQVELVQEYVKNWAWENNKPKGFDQVYLCAKQMRREEIPLRNGVDLIVTDSPLFLQCAYAMKYEVPSYQSLISIVKDFDYKYPSLNIFLERGDRPYVAKGRFSTHAEAKEMDSFIINMLQHYGEDFVSIPYQNVEGMKKLVIDSINK